MPFHIQVYEGLTILGARHQFNPTTKNIPAYPNAAFENIKSTDGLLSFSNYLIAASYSHFRMWSYSYFTTREFRQDYFRGCIDHLRATQSV